MKTKVMELNQIKKLPAGIFDGTEAFWYNNQKWVLHNGSAMPFENAPGIVQRLIANAFLNDRRSLDYMKKKMHITKFSEGFEMWYKCVIGGLDNVADFQFEKFTPDAFNNLCTDTTCPHRGKFCGVKSGINSYQVETILALKQGKSIAETAPDLYVSTAGMKSRVEKIKEKLHATNITSMMAIAAEIGV